jgi:hypothetical protein
MRFSGDAIRGLLATAALAPAESSERLEHLRLVAPAPPSVQRLERGRLHGLPWRRLPPGALHDRVLLPRPEDRRLPPIAISGYRQIAVLARQPVPDETDPVPGIEPSI